MTTPLVSPVILTATQLASHGPVRESGLSIGSQGAGGDQNDSGELPRLAWQLTAGQPRLMRPCPAAGDCPCPRLWGAVVQARQQHRPG
jgi:hypothetical protein